VRARARLRTRACCDAAHRITPLSPIPPSRSPQVPAVVRALAVVSVVRCDRAGDHSAPIVDAVADEALMRGSATLLGLARLIAAAPAGIPGLSPAPTSVTDCAGVDVTSSAAATDGATLGDGSAPSAAAPASERRHHHADSLATRSPSTHHHHRRSRSGRVTGAALDAVRASLCESLHRATVFRVLVKVRSTACLRGAHGLNS
jgi:hypothetical protein